MIGVLRPSGAVFPPFLSAVPAVLSGRLHSVFHSDCPVSMAVFGGFCCFQLLVVSMEISSDI